MNNARRNFSIDLDRRSAILNGREVQLQEKSWMVLSILVGRAPDIVTRETLIDEIWHGNFVTGDKGLNQAIWTIRSILGDDARAPQYIKTLPREGYQWILTHKRPSLTALKPGIFTALAASIVILTVATLTAPTIENGVFTLPERCSVENPADVQAYRVDRDLFIDYRNGCRLIVKPSGTKRFGSPLLSEDGKHIAFTVTEEQACKFVTVSLQTGNRAEFPACSNQKRYSSFQRSEGA